MKTKEFISELASRLEISQPQTRKMLDALVSDVVNGLVNGKSINIYDFGVFEIKKKTERISVNPMTQKRMLVPPKLVLAFKPNSKLKEKLNEK